VLRKRRFCGRGWGLSRRTTASSVMTPRNGCRLTDVVPWRVCLVEVECFNIIAVRVCVPWEGRLAIRNISAVVISISSGKETG
jgi:hypothetical protein